MKADITTDIAWSTDPSRPCWMTSLDHLLPGNGSGWKIHRIFKGPTASVKRISAHMSVLGPGRAPHPPHAHDEEELLMLLSGEADIVTVDNRSLTPATVRIVPGSVVYHAAFQRHTISSAGPGPAAYLIFKWCGPSGRRSVSMLPSTVFHGAGIVGDSISPPARQIARRVIFESPTQYLQKLRCHVSTLQPGAGYAEHADAYDVAIFTFSGTVETLGRQVGPRTMIFYAAGEPHGMKNAGEAPAAYMVIEFHGSRLRQKRYVLARKTVRSVHRWLSLHGREGGHVRTTGPGNG